METQQQLAEEYLKMTVIFFCKTEKQKLDLFVRMELIIILKEKDVLVLTKEYIQKKFAGIILTVIQKLFKEKQERCFLGFECTHKYSMKSFMIQKVFEIGLEEAVVSSKHEQVAK